MHLNALHMRVYDLIGSDFYKVETKNVARVEIHG